MSKSPCICPTQIRIHTRRPEASSFSVIKQRNTAHASSKVEQESERERVEVLFLDGHCVVILLTPHLSFDLSQLDKQNLSRVHLLMSTKWNEQRDSLAKSLCSLEIIPISRLAARPGLPFQIINWLFQFTVTMVTSFGCQSAGNHKYYLVSGSSVDPDKTRAASHDQGREI